METTGHVRGYLKTCQREHSREHVGGGAKGPLDDGGTKTKDEIKRWCSKSVKGRTQNFEGKCEQ